MNKKDNGFIDGCFDGFHYGHVYALFQSMKLCKKLHCATHSDDEIMKYKNAYPIFNLETRELLLKNCKFIDILHPIVPYETNIETVNKFNCDVFFHSSDIDEFSFYQQSLKNKIQLYNRTNGISSTDIINRIIQYKNKEIVKTNKDYIYLKYLFDEICSYYIKDYKNVVIIKCKFDIISKKQIELLSKIKNKYNDYDIFIDISEENMSYIYNKYEIAVMLLGLKDITNVIYDNKLYNFVKIILINTIVKDFITYTECIVDNSFNNDIKNNDENIYNFLNNLDITKFINKIYKPIITYSNFDLYFNTLNTQFNYILEYIKNINITEKDILIFDIDEVCLLNLMYTNNFNYEFLYNNYDTSIYNYDTGLNPIIKECEKLFEYIHLNNINYAFITGRKNYIRSKTIENLYLVGLNKYKYLFTCPNEYYENICLYKKKCRNEIRNKYNIKLCIGDQISDLSYDTDENECINFLIFNPFYFTK
jgi:cytidyltransferase-like protein